MGVAPQPQPPTSHFLLCLNFQGCHFGSRVLKCETWPRLTLRRLKKVLNTKDVDAVQLRENCQTKPFLHLKFMCVCVGERDSVHDLNEDMTSESRKGANGNTGIRSHLCMFLFIKQCFHMTCAIKKHTACKASLHFLYCTLWNMPPSF